VAYQQARKAELRKDWDTALVYYEKAAQAQPTDSKIIIHEQLVRTQAAEVHVQRGYRLLKEGRQDDAAGEFQRAVSTDPTNKTAVQELTKFMAAQAISKQNREIALKAALKANGEGANESAVKLKPFPQEPLAHIRIPSADSRKIFETLAKLANLNVAFTTTFQPRPLSLDLSNVKIEDAMNIVAVQTHSFWRPLTSNTILIVPDTTTDRRDYDTEIVKTIYLSNPLAPADRTAIASALKTVLGLQKIVDNPDSNAIVVRDSPARVAAAERLIHDLDRGKAEIVIEVSVVEASRDRVRQLGLYPATVSTSTGTVTPGLTGGLVFAPTVTTSSGTSTASSISIGSPLTLSSLRNDFALVIPSVAATALLNDNKSRILQNPQVRVTDGQTAKLKIGSRVPYATGSFAPSLSSTSNASTLLSSTQFQYQDVGVSLEITPHLLSNGEVAIKAVVEISSEAGNVTIAGVSEPTFGQRKIEHDICLKEGEVNVLGGLIQSTTTSTVQGLPFLSEIPGLRYFTSSTDTEVQETEVLVMMTPRVVRLPEPALGAVAVAGAPYLAGSGGAAGAESSVSEPPSGPPGEQQ
jgi:general secretion pathway protein D